MLLQNMVGERLGTWTIRYVAVFSQFFSVLRIERTDDFLGQS